VNQAILAQSRRTILVADHSKLQRSAPARIASLSEVETVVTDRSLPPALAARCRDWGTTVVVAGI
jgi:DeoR family glycerol-3-phosphate regulon repressor